MVLTHLWSQALQRPMLLVNTAPRVTAGAHAVLEVCVSTRNVFSIPCNLVSAAVLYTATPTRLHTTLGATLWRWQRASASGVVASSTSLAKVAQAKRP